MLFSDKHSLAFTTESTAPTLAKQRIYGALKVIRRLIAQFAAFPISHEDRSKRSAIPNFPVMHQSPDGTPDRRVKTYQHLYASSFILFVPPHFPGFIVLSKALR
jgi:hypothetical protein